MAEKRPTFLIPPCAVDASVTRPNLYHVVMRSLSKHSGRPINRVEERADVDLLMGFDVIAIIEEMSAVEGHGGSRLSKRLAADAYPSLLAVSR
jgi:hypothetical protein